MRLLTQIRTRLRTKVAGGAIGGVGGAAPVVTGGQSFSYVENQASGYNIGTVAATDGVGVTGFRFFSTGTATSADGFFSINSAGVVSLTVAGAANPVASDDFETGANTFTPQVQATNLAGNWSLPVAITINVTNADESRPVVTPGQSFSYPEIQSSGYVIGTVLATDDIAVTGFRFTTTATNTSSDGFFQISSGGVVTLTVSGASSAANDFEVGPNSFTHGVQASDTVGWGVTQNVTFNVTNNVSDDPSMLIGMNVGYTVDYSGNFVFANLLRNMRPWQRVDDGSFSQWVSQDQGRISGATTERFMAVVLDYKAGLPSQTLKFQNPNGNKFYFGGYGDPGPGVFSTALTQDVVYTAGNSIFLIVEGNVTGTMALLLAGHETSYAAGNEFSSDFLAFHAGLGTKVLRFMDGSATNTTLDQTWSDRTVTGKISFQGSGGIQIPYEVQADACNRIGADMWVNVPPRASTTTYTPSLASLLFTNLNVARKVYPERGNEIWNTANAAFARNTEWIRRAGHTRFNYTCSGTTFTKTAHGFSNDQLFQSFAPVSVSQVGVDSETQLANSSWATATSYTAGQYTRDPNGDTIVCLVSHTSGTYATDLAAAKWVRAEWYHLVSGQKLRIKVLTANTFELWTGAGGTGTKCAAPSLVTTMIGILSDEFGAMDETAEAAALNTQYAQLALADWTAFDTAFGGTSRVKATLGSQAAGSGNWTAQRLAVTGVAARCNHVNIAPYHNGHVWGGKVVPASGKITPYFFASEGGTGHCTVYTSGSTPTLTQRKAGTGTGFQTRLTPMAISALSSENDRSWRQGSDVTIADGTYKVYLDFVDPDGFTWSVSNTVVVGAAQPVVDFVDTDANQQLRDLWNMDSGAGDIKFIQDHLALIAASSNPAITLINYEGGSHQNYYPPAGSGLDTWYRAHRKSATYAQTLTHYYNILSAAGVKLHCHYMDVSGQGPGYDDTPWRIAETYAGTTDARYGAVAAFSGAVPTRTLVDSSTVTGNNFATAPTYPATIATFSDATLTYSVVPRGTIDDGNYSISGNVLSLTATGSINYAAPATQEVWIRATDGYTDAYFKVQFTTGDAWYSSSKQLAWSYITDTTPAQLNPIDLSGASPTSSAATVVSDGWDIGGVAEYIGGGAPTLPYTSNPLFLFAGRPDGDTTNYAPIIQFGNGPSVQIVNQTTAIEIFVNGGSLADLSIACTNTLAVFWLYFDNTNLKYYYGKNQTTSNPSGTAYASQGAAAFPGNYIFGGTSSWVVSAFETAPAADLTAALALVQKAQTHLGI